MNVIYTELTNNTFYKKLNQSNWSLYFEYYWFISMFKIYRVLNWFKPKTLPVKDKYEVFIDEKI
jgi:hypothetical protein